MKTLFLSICFAIASTTSIAQDGPIQYEYLTVNVVYGIKTSGFVNKVYIDIGKTGGHSLNGKVTNDDDMVLIGNYKYDNAIDLLNYLGKDGWQVIHYNEIKILSDSYFSYILEKRR